MCVILVPTKEHPPEETLYAAEKVNPHGGGIAWKNTKGKLSYEKAIDADRIIEIIKEKNPPIPYIIHFRIASVGEVCPKLTHPFPVNKQVKLKTKGTENKALLFHNGTWSEWKESIMPFSGAADFPEGSYHDWSDSRALAYMAYKTKRGFLKFIDEKIAIIEKNGNVDIYGTWHKRQGIWSSNLHHVRSENTYHGNYGNNYSYDTYYGYDNLRHHNHQAFGDTTTFTKEQHNLFERTKIRDDIDGA